MPVDPPSATRGVPSIKIDVKNVLPDVIIADIGDNPVRFWIIEAVATDGVVTNQRRKALLEWAAQQNIKARVFLLDGLRVTKFGASSKATQGSCYRDMGLVRRRTTPRTRLVQGQAGR